MKIYSPYLGQTFFSHLLERKFGTVLYKEKTLWLIQEAYIDDTLKPDPQQYAATAIDSDGKRYSVRWDCVEGWEDFEDQSLACDWETYTITEYDKDMNHETESHDTCDR